jgi:hypothetical protein
MTDTTDKTLKAVREAEKDAEDKYLIRLSSGVVLRGKQVPPLTMMKVMAYFQRPKPPVYFNETMGREIENPDDPDYRDRLQAYSAELGSAMLNVFIILGTEVVQVPKKFPGHMDDIWLKEYAEFGVGPAKPDNESWRYLTWVTLKAVLDENDVNLIQEVVGSATGVTEKAVAAGAAFPGRNGKSRGA